MHSRLSPQVGGIEATYDRKECTAMQLSRAGSAHAVRRLPFTRHGVRRGLSPCTYWSCPGLNGMKGGVAKEYSPVSPLRTSVMIGSGIPVRVPKPNGGS